MIDPEFLLDAYAQGIFPMAEDASDTYMFWVRPERRGILLCWKTFTCPVLWQKRSGRNVLISVLIRTSTVSSGHVQKRQEGRSSTWINGPIWRVYGELFALGTANKLKHGAIAVWQAAFMVLHWADFR